MVYSIKEVEQKCIKEGGGKIHFDCIEIARSLEDRPLYLMTLSSIDALNNKMPVIFLTCRVHCGETPGSYMLQGVLDKLTQFGNIHTDILLQNYVFKIIPMLNPDGVARGYWRYDTLGLNLNRHYTEPSRELHPTIWATKNYILDESHSGRLKMYVDFHAHVTKRGCFIFGNTISNKTH